MTSSYARSRCEHYWKRKPGGLDRIALREKQFCANCGRERRVALQRCPRCNSGPIGSPVDPKCFVCNGERVIPVAHTCRCCESRNLAKGAALCLSCLGEHGYQREYICSRKTPADVAQEKELGL